jgi:mono/diheme cytochrome c family protein
MNRTLPAVCITVLAIWPLITSGIAAEVTYADVAPIMQQQCIMCHSGPGAVRGVRLDTYDGIIKGGDRGAIVRSGDPGASELIRRVKGESAPRMPMTGPPFLNDSQISVLEKWIASGMPAGTMQGPDEDKSDPLAHSLPAGVTFDRIAPILAMRCAKCHTDNGIMGDAPEGYRLTSYDAVTSSEDRARVIPGNPPASELLRRIRGQSLPRMPLDGPPWLSAEEIALVEEWIATGAMNSAAEEAAVPAGARVRLEGTLQESWRLDDLPLEITSRTRIDKNPHPGDRVRIRATVRADGSLEISRIQRR